MNSELIRSQFQWCEWPTQFGFECCWISNTKNNSDLHSERSCIAYQDEIHNFCSFQLRFDIIQMQRERNMFSDKWIKTFEFHHAQIAICFFFHLSLSIHVASLFLGKCRRIEKDKKKIPIEWHVVDAWSVRETMTVAKNSTCTAHVHKHKWMNERLDRVEETTTKSCLVHCQWAAAFSINHTHTTTT